MSSTTTVAEVEECRDEFLYLRSRFLRERGWESCGGLAYFTKTTNGRELRMSAKDAFELEKAPPKSTGLLSNAELGSLWKTRDGKCVVLVSMDPRDTTWGYYVDRDDWPVYEVTTSSYGVNVNGIQSTGGDETKWDVVEPWEGEPDAKAARVQALVLAGKYSRF